MLTFVILCLPTDLNWWAQIFTVITGISTFALAIIGVVGVSAALQTLETIKTQTTELQRQAEAAETRAKTAAIAADAAKASADGLINSERAIIVVDLKMQPPPTIAGPPSGNVFVRCHCQNFGRTVGTITEVRSGSHVVDSIDGLSKEPNLVATNPIDASPRNIAPEKATEYDIEVSGGGRARNQTLVIYGVVKYRHRFSMSEVQTRFGFSFGPNGSLERLNSHPEYNSHT